jgi:8-hydroxy-5-deazaflavin:NADPH oxidoreductase
MAPGAKVVKAFNTIGANIMADPNFNGRSALLLHCGDDAEAKASVSRLATEIGFETQDAGPLKQARALEPLALLGVSLAYVQSLGREFAFQIIKRAP